MTRVNSNTYTPPLIDNVTLLEGQDRLERAQEESQHTERVLEIVQAAVDDSKNSKTIQSKLSELKSDYLESDEFEDIVLPLYLAVCDLWLVLTERQQKILYKFACERFRITDIAVYYNISAPGVLKTIKLIQKKAMKLNINQFT